jgi:hypothetical protein
MALGAILQLTELFTAGAAGIAFVSVKLKGKIKLRLVRTSENCNVIFRTGYSL